jgi:hypothetical protein
VNKIQQWGAKRGRICTNVENKESVDFKNGAKSELLHWQLNSEQVRLKEKGEVD